MAQRNMTAFGNLVKKLRHILFPRSSWPVRFNSRDIHRPVSTQDFVFITKLESSNYEFVEKPVGSC